MTSSLCPSSSLAPAVVRRRMALPSAVALAAPSAEVARRADGSGRARSVHGRARCSCLGPRSGSCRPHLPSRPFRRSRTRPCARGPCARGGCAPNPHWPATSAPFRPRRRSRGRLLGRRRRRSPARHAQRGQTGRPVRSRQTRAVWSVLAVAIRPPALSLLSKAIASSWPLWPRSGSPTSLPRSRVPDPGRPLPPAAGDERTPRCEGSVCDRAHVLDAADTAPVESAKARARGFPRTATITDAPSGFGTSSST